LGGVTQLNYVYNIAEANTVEIYAEFEGNNQYSKSNTCLIENVDGVLQSNCYNKILLIQDDSSFQNLIVSVVLSEMGVGTGSLESILTNQADSTDFANFEDLLLEALQDELDLGNTDLSMQEMLELLEDPSLAVNYKTSQPKTTTNLDSDGDGIPDSLDQCDYQKETFNNYIDFDGCPDTKPPTPNINIRNTVSDYDNDGIPDYRDECMYIKENYNGYEDTDGCLDIKPIITTIPTPTTPTKSIPSFVDPNKDPKNYVKRYVTEESYKKWYDGNYPEYAFHEALGITKTQFNNLVKEVKNENSSPPEKPQIKKQQCGDGTELVNGICQLTTIEEEEIVEKVKQKFCFLWWCW